MKRLLLLLLAPLFTLQIKGHCNEGETFVCEDKWSWVLFKKVPYCDCKKI